MEKKCTRRQGIGVWIEFQLIGAQNNRDRRSTVFGREIRTWSALGNKRENCHEMGERVADPQTTSVRRRGGGIIRCNPATPSHTPSLTPTPTCHTSGAGMSDFWGVDLVFSSTPFFYIFRRGFVHMWLGSDCRAGNLVYPEHIPSKNRSVQAH